MTIQELRELFIKEHKRDRRLIFINYGIISFIVLLVLGLIAFLFYATNTNPIQALSEAFGGREHDPWYVKYVLIAIMCGAVIYPFYHIWKLSKRPQKIEDLLSRIESGAKATTVHDSKEYKVTIPLLKVNIKLCPVTMASIYLDNDVKPYLLPINSFYLADMKILLSGGNVQKLNEIKRALYADDDTETSTQQEVEKIQTPLKTTEEFRTFLNENLKDTIVEIDKQRGFTRKMTMIVVPVVILAVLGIAGYYYYSSIKGAAAGDYSVASSTPLLLLFFGGITAIGFGYSYFVRWKHKKTTGTQSVSDSDIYAAAAGNSLNETVFRKIIKFINPTVEYMPMGHVGLPEFLESGLYQEKNYNIHGNDQISGRHNGVPFIMCELWVTHKRNFSDEKDKPDSVFSGQFFVAKFNKKFSSSVYIKPRKGSSGYTHITDEKIKLEDPEFMDMFDVYGTDQVEARYILTPSTMERIKNIAKRTKGEFYIAFNNNKITITNNSKNTKFGVGFFDSLTKDDNKLLVDFYETIRDQFAIIDDLKLNVKIWG
ncbi:heme/copper-type cytochrome/quinol oxidase subunit 2 [Dysgonomonas sp. PH5-45]|uniref:DUF3137 domain-containing protein n=1 Tax=unclassified Dysgonomonas TaxID=2630389 RepID=UPI002474B617|nr:MULTISPECIES: DUF3137 domain-containing protein [unclassified Dysgonomonas]MDH6354907.1 heme/copper-type cytochrome/quinol oxidase subunit 2 [Dysgonomonas sp. PH5-45]MDH6387806.1 heme/copper-type cytochrome/quinol oxidase subunit 2 [Dysgonomonas sp. PH5-37]